MRQLLGINVSLSGTLTILKLNIYSLSIFLTKFVQKYPIINLAHAHSGAIFFPKTGKDDNGPGEQAEGERGGERHNEVEPTLRHARAAVCRCRRFTVLRQRNYADLQLLLPVLCAALVVVAVAVVNSSFHALLIFTTQHAAIVLLHARHDL